MYDEVTNNNKIK